MNLLQIKLLFQVVMCRLTPSNGESLLLLGETKARLTGTDGEEKPDKDTRTNR